LTTFSQIFVKFLQTSQKVLKFLQNFVKMSIFRLSTQPSKTAFFTTVPFLAIFCIAFIKSVTKNFEKTFAKKHNFLQKLPKFPVFGPKMGSGRVPPKSGQKWQK
jgi:hypothetical protein